MTTLALKLVEMGVVNDVLTRWGIRRLLRERLEKEHEGFKDRRNRLKDLIRTMGNSPVAVATREANEQHYELPAEFFVNMLGPRLKYSSCYWEHDDDTLESAETAMLDITCERAGLRDGMHVLELGCGWGSLTMYMAKRYPNSSIVAVSNSASQRAFINSTCEQRGFLNVTVVTSDMNEFTPQGHFDRVLSVEMLEHMRNWEELLTRIRSWLKLSGKLFVHVFCHREFGYLFETENADDWMGRYFFTGGLMPSFDLISRFPDVLRVEKSWSVNGNHYARTLLEWLERLDARREAVMPILERTYGKRECQRWFYRWRLFLLACAELFAFSGGDEWFVAHYLLSANGATYVEIR